MLSLLLRLIILGLSLDLNLELESVNASVICILIRDMNILLSCEGNSSRALPHVERENVDNQTKKDGGVADRQAGGTDAADKEKWDCDNSQVIEEELAHKDRQEKE